MKRLMFTTVVAFSLSVPALANEQLALSLGVEPGVYTTAELVQLKAAEEDEGGNRFQTIARQGREVISTQSIGSTAAAAQLAASLGVDPGGYSLSELAQLHSAVANDDRWQIRSIKSGSTEIVSTQSIGDMSGRSQLATDLGVDPAATSMTDLAKAYLGKYD